MWRHLFFNQNIDELNCAINTIYQDNTFKNIKISIEHEKYFFDMIGSQMPVKEAELYKKWLEKEWLEKERFNNEDEHYLAVMTINTDDIIFSNLLHCQEIMKLVLAKMLINSLIVSIFIRFHLSLQLLELLALT